MLDLEKSLFGICENLGPVPGRIEADWVHKVEVNLVSCDPSGEKLNHSKLFELFVIGGVTPFLSIRKALSLSRMSTGQSEALILGGVNSISVIPSGNPSEWLS